MKTFWFLILLAMVAMTAISVRDDAPLALVACAGITPAIVGALIAPLVMED